MHLLLPGKDSLNGKCQKLVTELGLSKQIHFLGFRNDIPKLLKISDLALSAAMQEGLPVNILEAMYLGLPIVATDCRGNRDLVKDGVNGYLIALNDKERFAERIKKIYLSKDNYRSFGINSQIMIKDYSLEKVIDKLSNIYFKNEKMGDGKMKKYRIGYTQGTYDLFHIGHLNLLEHAKEQCDYLIVGVNTERLVREYKNKQPIISENDRARIVSEIKYVDKVLLTDTLDKIEIAKEIKPDAIFIGDDWKNNERWIKTKEDMKKMGIDVVFLPHTDGISTTKIVAKIGGAS